MYEKMTRLFILILLTFLLSSPVLGATKKRSKKKGTVVEINFDDELLVKGKFLSPSLFTLYQKRNVELGKLIKPKKDFLPEMRATLGDIQSH